MNVDVNVGCDGLCDDVDSIGTAGAVFRGKDGRKAVTLGELHDLVGVGGDKDLVELTAGAGGAIDPGEHGLAGDLGWS